MSTAAAGAPVVLWLSGTSSVGKTSIVEHLRVLLHTPPHDNRVFLTSGIDSFLGWLPECFVTRPPTEKPMLDTTTHFSATNGDVDVGGIRWECVSQSPPEYRVCLGAKGLSFMRGYYAALGAMARAGNDMIIDDVFFFNDPAIRAEFLALQREVFAGCQLLMIKVHAPLGVVEQRERQRGNRVLGQARGHYQVCHLGVNYDFEVDTTTEAPQLSAKKIVDWFMTTHHPATDQFHTIFNFRSMKGKSVDGGATIKDRVLYRCAIPMNRLGSDEQAKAETASAVSHDLKLLHDVYGVRTLIDLRAEDESSVLGVLAAKAGMVHVSAPVLPREVTKEVVELLPKEAQDHLAKCAKSEYLTEFVRQTLVLPFGFLYQPIFKYGKTGIATAFKTLVNPANLPAVICCSQGKDRTGIAMALILRTLGCDKQTIQADYQESLVDGNRHLLELCHLAGFSPDRDQLLSSREHDLLQLARKHAGVDWEVLEPLVMKEDLSTFGLDNEAIKTALTSLLLTTNTH